MWSMASASAASRAPASEMSVKNCSGLRSTIGPNPKKGKILKINKGFGGRMGVEVAPAHDLQIAGTGLLRPARQHDPRSLQGIALGPFVQHQRNPGIGEDIL